MPNYRQRYGARIGCRCPQTGATETLLRRSPMQVEAPTSSRAAHYRRNPTSVKVAMLKTALRTLSSQNTGPFSIAIAMLAIAIHQDRRWFMRIVQSKCTSKAMRARERDGSAPPPALRRRHTKPTALELRPRPTEVQPRAYTCMYQHDHGRAYGRQKGPRSPGSRMRRAGGPALPHAA